LPNKIKLTVFSIAKQLQQFPIFNINLLLLLLT